MKSSRQKGLDFVREVKRILEGINHIVEGPGYGSVFYEGRIRPIHKDFFGVYDLMSFDGKIIIGHQVTTEQHKSEKIKNLQEARLPGWVWCRFSDKEGGRGAGFEVYKVDGEEVIESEMTYGIRRKLADERRN